VSFCRRVSKRDGTVDVYDAHLSLDSSAFAPGSFADYGSNEPIVGLRAVFDAAEHTLKLRIAASGTTQDDGAWHGQGMKR